MEATGRKTRNANVSTAVAAGKRQPAARSNQQQQEATDEEDRQKPAEPVYSMREGGKER